MLKKKSDSDSKSYQNGPGTEKTENRFPSQDAGEKNLCVCVFLFLRLRVLIEFLKN